MSDLPNPECPWDEKDKSNRSKSKTVLWLGILFAAVSLGTVSIPFYYHISFNTNLFKIRLVQSTELFIIGLVCRNI